MTILAVVTLRGYRTAEDVPMLKDLDFLKPTTNWDPSVVIHPPD